MLSYCWAQQAIILKIRKALGARGYHIWIDGERHIRPSLFVSIEERLLDLALAAPV